MKKKDPAFLFYPKDWLDGTSEMLPEEKGVYIDLLCHQHQHGSIPSDLKRIARIVRLSESQLEPIWEVVKTKWIPNGEPNGERLVNPKMSDVMAERLQKGEINRITGTFASVLRLANLSKKEYGLVRSMFKIDEFKGIDNQNLTERLTEWLHERLKSIANANANGDIISSTVIDNSTSSITKKVHPEFEEAWNGFIEMRKKIKKPLTSRGEELAKATLRKLAGTDVELAIKIINQSVEHSWQTFYQLKEPNSSVANESTPSVGIFKSKAE